MSARPLSLRIAAIRRADRREWARRAMTMALGCCFTAEQAVMLMLIGRLSLTWIEAQIGRPSAARVASRGMVMTIRLGTRVPLSYSPERLAA